MNSYEEINGALNEVLLGGRYEGRPLYLVLDNRARDQLADVLDQHPEEVEAYCCRIVGEYLGTTGDPYEQVDHALIMWEILGRVDPPPFTAVLFALSHAAELMVSDEDYRASNYYERLASLTGVARSRLATYGKSTHPYWLRLGKWLADNDFRYGRPTARAVNSNKYVGVAMSQAIVREVDRKRFHEMFAKYGFTGTDKITESEVEQYVSTYMCSSRPTRQLKAAWAKAELRSRICEVVIAELEEWKDTARTPGQRAGNATSRLSLAASFRQDVLTQTRAINIWFGQEAAIETVELSSAAQSLQLGNSTFGGFATLEPRTAIDTGDALSRGLALLSPSGQAFSWTGRAAIPLSRSEKGHYWTEVNRVSLGLEHLVLVRSDPKIRDLVERALGEVAVPGYTVATPDRLRGLPPGWILYEGVRVTRALDELKGFEAVLSPIAVARGLQFVGGLGLGRGIWHEWEPPIAVLDAEKRGVSLKAWEGASNEGELLREAKGAETSVALDVRDCGSQSGNLFVEGSVAGETTSSATILLRSANKARPLDRQMRGVVSYSGVLQTRPPANGQGCRGLVAPPVAMDFPALELIEGFRELGPLPTGEPEPEEPQQPLKASAAPALELARLSTNELIALPCAVRGFHYLKYETLPPGYPRYAPVNVECKGCGITFLHHRRPASQQGSRDSRPRQPVPQSPAHYGPAEQVRLEMDLWLDAAGFLGTGNLATFEALVASADVDPWRAAAILRDLGWLGHLDLETGPAHRVKAWSVAPPVISFSGEEDAFLAGFRSKELVEEVRRKWAEAGGRVSVEASAVQPSLVRLRGLTVASAQAIVADLMDPHKRPVQVVEGAAARIAGFALASGSPLACLNPVTLGWDNDVAKFDVSQARWRSASGATEAGAYRLAYAGTSYVFRAASGKAFSGPHELVKLAAARLEGTTLHAYRESEQVFVSRLGCEPVGLLGRALVACSGKLPTVIDGTARFERVPPAVAAAVLSALYDGDLPS